MRGFRKLGEPLFNSGLPRRLQLGSRVGSGGVLTPLQRILSTSPLAFLIGNDVTGTVVTDYSGNGHNAASNTALSGWTPTAEFQGYNVPYFSGGGRAWNWMPVGSGLPAALNMREFSFLQYVKINAAAWVDGANHYLCEFSADADNKLQILKTAIDNQIRFTYEAANTQEQYDHTTLGPTDWIGILTTVSKTADQVKWYINNVQIGATQTGLGSFTGALTEINIGANAVSGSSDLEGYTAFCSLWTHAITDAERNKVFF